MATCRRWIFDAVYNDYRGVVIYVRVFHGTVKKTEMIRMMGTMTHYEVMEVGKLTPHMTAIEVLHAGEEGYIVANIKKLQDVVIGDTVTHQDEKLRSTALPGFKQPKPMVFCGFYPTVPSEYENLRKALEKLRLNDSSFTFEPETSDAARLRLPLRLPRPVAHGSHPAAARARGRPGPGADGADGALPRQADQRRRQGDPLAERTAGRLGDRRVPGADHARQRRRAAEYIGAVMKICTDRRGQYVKTRLLRQGNG